MIQRKYNLKYCCDDICIFPSRTLLNYDDESFKDSFGLTAVSTYQLKTNQNTNVENEEQKKKGRIYFYRLAQNEENDDNGFEVNHILSYEKNVNIHSLCFAAFDKKPEKICVTFSNGDVFLLSDQQLVKSWRAHDYHVWSCEFTEDENTIITGSDDCSLIMWDMRTSDICQKNTRSHSQGVTDVKFEKLGQLVYTACYDNMIRVFDIRNLQKPVRTLDVESSIWRIKFLYKNNTMKKLLVAACDGGAKVFKKINDDFIFEKGICNNKELTYGIDVIDVFDREKKKKKKIYLSCSFYNKEVQMWV
ncbi:diphthine methyltransferase, putative [Hepatocystis sp. ex Piliocolobus tephrosceles]|nr:diphthine methyltransferase, putative [Hepatocystis sp. ex Piliocolobus tephrosceles]